MRNQTMQIKNEKGMATIETLPLLFLFIFLMSYTLGGFGVVHSGIKNSIAARTYAFETFRNRSNLIYLRDAPDSGARNEFKQNGNRTHAIASEVRGDTTTSFIVTERPLRVGMPSSPDGIKNARGGSSMQIHNDEIFAQNAVVGGKRINQRLEVNPVWVIVQYGICLNVNCGDH
jgi:hypothetical protein